MKTQILRSALKSWVKVVFKNPSHLKIKFQTELATLHSRMENDEVTSMFFSQEKEMNMKILNAARQEEEVWRFKSRQLWLKGGDINTEYFHKKTKAWHSFSTIKGLKDQNRIILLGRRK